VTPPPLLSLAGLVKRYGETLAVAGVNLDLRPGEVVALLGENGAGKSTIVNMISGMAVPDAGEIRLAGHEVRLASSRDALAAGIGVVHQHYSLVPGFTVVEAFALGRGGVAPLDRAALRAEVRALGQQVGITIDPDARIGSLDVAAQQRVEILKALALSPRILLLDEPTAVLTQVDADRFFAVVRRLRDTGTAVILVTHRLADVFAVCDRTAVMHAGRLVADRPVADVTREDLVSLMIHGRSDVGHMAPAVLTADIEADTAPAACAPASVSATAEPVLMAEGLELRRANGSVAVAGLGFDLRPGEILAVAGVDGNGQSELVTCLAGLARPAQGSIRFGPLDSRDAQAWTSRRLRAAGLAHVPDDRRRLALVGDMELDENFLLGRSRAPRYLRHGLIDRRRLRADLDEAVRDYDIRSAGPGQTVDRLSGGNQQKLVLARELAGEPRILLAAHPSRGLDLRTIGFVQDLLRRRRAAGTAILLVSADLGEIWGLADRLLVLGGGRAHGPVETAGVTREEVGAWMAGH